MDIIVVAATHCNTLRHAATHCNTLQHAATLPVPTQQSTMDIIVETTRFKKVSREKIPAS